MADLIKLRCRDCGYVTDGSFERGASIGMTCKDCKGFRWETLDGEPYLTLEDLQALRDQIVTVIDGRCGDDMCEWNGSYFMSVRCTNCGLHGEIRCTKGHEGGQTARSNSCPRCDCRQLVVGDYLRDGEDAEPEEDEDAPSS